MKTKDHTQPAEPLFYRIYRFPVGVIYLVGDKCTLKEVCFELPGEHATLPDAVQKGSTPPLAAAVDFLRSYFNGMEGPVPCLDLTGCTEKQKRVYRELMKIGFGKTISYTQLAELAGIPRGARFIGNTMAKNPLPVFIPCHRVIKADGSTGNFSGGVGLKEYLLAHEKAIASDR